MELFIVWIILSIFPGIIAKNKGYGFIGYFLLSLLLSPLIGFIWVLIMKPNEAGQVKSGQSRKCPYCAELIRPEAIVCRFCHKDLPPYIPPPAPVAEPRKELTPEERRAGRKGLWKIPLIFFILIVLGLVADYFASADESIVFGWIDSLSSKHSFRNSKVSMNLPKLKFETIGSAIAAMDILIAPNSDKDQIKELLVYLFKLNAPAESYKSFVIRVYDLKEVFDQRGNNFYPEEKYWTHHIADISRDNGKTNIFWNHWDYERNKVVSDVIPVY